jgi:hypothetical protein
MLEIATAASFSVEMRPLKEVKWLIEGKMEMCGCDDQQRWKDSC